jgi:hypothetical protein
MYQSADRSSYSPQAHQPLALTNIVCSGSTGQVPPSRGSPPCHGREAYDLENLCPGPHRDVTGYVPFSTSTSPGWALYAPVFDSGELPASPPLSMHEVVSLTTELHSAPCRSASRGCSLAIPTGGLPCGLFFSYQPGDRRRLAPRHCGLTTGYR